VQVIGADKGLVSLSSHDEQLLPFVFPTVSFLHVKEGSKQLAVKWEDAASADGEKQTRSCQIRVNALVCVPSFLGDHCQRKTTVLTTTTLY